MRPAAREAYAALDKGDFERCAALAAKLGGSTPAEQSEAYYLMARALEGVGKTKEASQCAIKAVNLHPAPQSLAYLARLFVQLHDHGNAHKAAAEALKGAGEDASVLDTIGNVFARLGKHEEAAATFERAVKIAPSNTEMRFNLATSLGFIGREVEAKTQFERTVEADPGHGRAWLALVRLDKQKAPIPALEKAASAAQTPDEQTRLGYACAKVAEDLGDHEGVIAALNAANEAFAKAHDTSIALDLENMKALKTSFADPGYFASDAPSAQAEGPIFVIGMPRTGTTLTDRILSSHPDVTSAGELQSMPLAVKEASGTQSRAILDPETIAALSKTSPSEIAERYLTRARQLHGTHSARFVDKLPANFLYAGYIARAMPSARIVCLRRNPMDSIWSNYKHLFALGSLYYRYAYDLKSCARYYVAFDGLMTFWQQALPGRIHVLEYETLVADQEGQTRALLDACGLSWNERCLNFHENTAAVATPSSTQVRQPLNASSIGRWKAYEAALQPAIRILEAVGISIR
ncbi:MAG: sulfotransferase [Pseudomonadota bacterium]